MHALAEIADWTLADEAKNGGWTIQDWI